MHRYRSGFTLLELVIVIAILGILTGTFVIGSFSGAQKRANDVRRKTDVKNIQTAMEQYFSACGNVYPTGPLTSIVCNSQSILNPLPQDPKTNAAYPFPTLSAGSYRVCTNSLEYESPTGFCLQNQQ